MPRLPQPIDPIKPYDSEKRIRGSENQLIFSDLTGRAIKKLSVDFDNKKATLIFSDELVASFYTHDRRVSVVNDCDLFDDVMGACITECALLYRRTQEQEGVYSYCILRVQTEHGEAHVTFGGLDMGMDANFVCYEFKESPHPVQPPMISVSSIRNMIDKEEHIQKSTPLKSHTF